MKQREGLSDNSMQGRFAPQLDGWALGKQEKRQLGHLFPPEPRRTPAPHACPEPCVRRREPLAARRNAPNARRRSFLSMPLPRVYRCAYRIGGNDRRKRRRDAAGRIRRSDVSSTDRAETSARSPHLPHRAGEAPYVHPLAPNAADSIMARLQPTSRFSRGPKKL